MDDADLAIAPSRTQPELRRLSRAGAFGATAWRPLRVRRATEGGRRGDRARDFLHFLEHLDFPGEGQ